MCNCSVFWLCHFDYPEGRAGYFNRTVVQPGALPVTVQFQSLRITTAHKLAPPRTQQQRQQQQQQPW